MLDWTGLDRAGLDHRTKRSVFRRAAGLCYSLYGAGPLNPSLIAAVDGPEVGRDKVFLLVAPQPPKQSPLCLRRTDARESSEGRRRRDEWDEDRG